MKLKWSELKIITLAVFNRFKKGKTVTYQFEENLVYRRYRTRIVPRTPQPGSASVTLQNSEQHWNSDARKFCSPLAITVPLTDEQRDELGLFTNKPSWPVKPPHRFGMSLMFNQNGKTVYESTASANTSIEAVSAMINHGSTQKSRLNLVVRPEFAGQPLVTALLALSTALQHTNSSSCGALYQWKVMSPQLGTKGPESAVIYLSANLEDGRVQHLIQNLHNILRGNLISLQSCPWGHVEYPPGIYGVDLPDENREKQVFGKSYGSSAGRLMSAIICTAAQRAAAWLYYDEDSVDRRAKLITTPNGEREFVRSQLEEVLEELGWELVD